MVWGETEQEEEMEKEKGLLERLGDFTGIGAIVRAALDAEEAAIGRLEALARKHGVSERKILGARRMKEKSDKLAFYISLLFPIVPNRSLLTAMAGRSKRKTAAGPKTKTSARPTTRGGSR